MLEGMITTPAEQQQVAGIVHAEAERMTRLVNQLLDLARLESGQLVLNREPIELSELIDQIVRGLSVRAQEKGVVLEQEVRPVPAVQGDPDRLTQVFLNLLDNAIRFTPATGRVTARLEPSGSNWVEVRIQDTGPGIPAEDLPRVFERFYQVDKSRASVGEERGAGLGLAITRELVEAHGGSIEASSAPGQGATFTVRLPVAPSARRSDPA